MTPSTPSAVLALAASQLREVTRQPVFGVGVAIGATIIAMSPALAMFALGRADALVLDLGASAMLFFGALIAATAIATSAAERLQDGTATLVLTRPIGPFAWIAGGFLGSAAALLQAGVILGTILLMTARNGPTTIHRGVVLPFLTAVLLALAWGVRASLRGRSFQPATLGAATWLLPVAFLSGLFIDRGVRLGPPDAIDGVALTAALLATLAATAFAALGTCLATRLAPAAAAALTLIGFVLGSLVQPAASATSSAGSIVAGALALVVPDLQLFWVADAAYAGVVVPLDYVVGVTGYTALYVTGALGVGGWLLGGRELG